MYRSKHAVAALFASAIVASSLACRSTTPPPAPVATTAPATQPDLRMSGPSAAPPKYVQPTAFDYPQLLGPPPADDSDAHRGEIDKVLSLQADRTKAQAERCRSEEVVTVFAFTEVLGPWFNERDLPATAALMQQAFVDAKAASDAAKTFYGRKRPPVALPDRVKPCVKLEPSNSYPSGHATRGVMWAVLLADAFPAKRDALLARGREIGTNRVLAGMHWPTDVEAGQTLGAAIAEKLLADPAFRADFELAKAEMLARAPK